VFESILEHGERQRWGWAGPMRPTFRYWMETEVHVYAFSIAANVLLSFFPFLIVLLSLCRYVFEWRAAEDAIYLALGDFFPGELGEFVRRNLRATVTSRGAVQITSLLILLFAANGVFQPLEVALNRAWGVALNRSFLKNQILSLGMILACGSLATSSTILTAANRQFLTSLFGSRSHLTETLGLVVFKAAALGTLMLVVFLIYWLLPNRRVPARAALPVAFVVGMALEALKYANLLVWPVLRRKLQFEYGPFVYSVSIVLVSFMAAMIVLAGAEWTARQRLAPVHAEGDSEAASSEN